MGRLDAAEGAVMLRSGVLGLMATLVLVLASVAGGPAARAQAPPVPTFTKDVAPILYANCVSCHRAGEVAPMPLLTYAEVRPWAQAISRRTGEGSMPPWHADGAPGTFINERRLTGAEKETLARWASSGAPQGDPEISPAPPAFADGWAIGTPDRVFEMLEDYAVPARGTIEYENFYIPTGFTETRWLKAIEARPGNRALVHHILVYYEAPAEGARQAAILQADPQDSRIPQRAPGNRPPQRPVGPQQLIATYAPGTNPQVFPTGTALRLAPGGVLHLQMHYSTNGTAGTDRSRVALVFAKEPPATEMRASQFLNGRLVIPPGAANEAVSTNVGFAQDATVWGALPAHARAREEVAIRPDAARRHVEADPLGAALRLQLADLLHVCRTAHRPQGLAPRSHRHLRQLGQQQVQSRPHHQRPLGRADARRNAILRHHLLSRSQVAPCARSPCSLP
jgi:hypothetical protein